MADTTATLGIAVESGEASRNLKDFSAVVKQLTDAATKFEANLSRLNRGIGELPSTLRNANNEAGRHASQMERTATSTQKASAAATFLTKTLQGMVAALAGGAIYKAIELSVNKLAELGDMASDTRLGKDFLQGLRIGAAEARVSTSELNSAIEAFTKVSKQAVPEAKEFYKALSAISPSLAQAFKDQSGKAGGQEERLKIIADALKNARSETERYQLAQKALGTDSDRVIELFVRGRQALDDYVAKAREFGIIVDDAYIRKAQEAQKSLGTLATVIADKLRMAIVDLLPSLRAAVPYLGALATKVQDFLAGYLDLQDQPEGTLERRLESDRKELERLEKQLENVDLWDKWTGGADDLRKRIADLKKEIADIPGILVDKHMANLKPPATNDNKPPGFSGRSSLRDNPFDSQINSIQKHIAALNADADAVGKTAAEHARLRVEAQLVEAGLRSGLSEAAVRSSADFKRLGDAAEAAAQKLALARVQNQIKFDRNTAFLTQEDVQIASQLRDIYPNVAEALNSVEAAAMRTNNAMRDLSGVASQQLTTGLADIFDGTKSVSDGFRDMSKAIVRALEEAMIKMLIVAPIMRSMQALMGGFGIGTGAGTLTGSDAAVNSMLFPGYGTASANGNVFPANDNGISRWSSQIVSQPTLFAFANGVGLMGEAGAEAIMPLRRGPDGKLGVQSHSGGGSTSISFGDINITLPEGTSPENAAAVGQAVKASVQQAVDERMVYHLRARGMLNRAS